MNLEIFSFGNVYPYGFRFLCQFRSTRIGIREPCLLDPVTFFRVLLSFVALFRILVACKVHISEHFQKEEILKTFIELI